MSGKPTLFVCTHRRMGSAGACGDSGGVDLADTLRRHVQERGLGWSVRASTCLGHCQQGPNIKAAPGGPLLHGCSQDRAVELVDHLLAEWKPPPGGKKA